MNASAPLGEPANRLREQSLGEEIANGISHGLGLVLALAGVPWLLVHAARRGDAAYFAGAILFGTTVLLLYGASTIYHALPAGRAKRVFKILDHSSIYLLIAGTYAPFTLGVLRGGMGWTLFGIEWSLAIAGVVLKSIGKVSHPVLSTGLYLVMGWMVVIAADSVLARIPTAGLLLLLAGGMSYTLGVAFYATDWRVKYGHLVWHLFVLAGTACHYFAVIWYAA